MLEMLKERKAALEARGKKGFTLMEMLIVIAIIAVLVAIAIPVLGAQLDRAKAATDEANIRDGYAAVQVELLNAVGTSTAVDGTYQLQKDGTVAKKDTASATPYITQGDASKLGGDPNIGGLSTTIVGSWKPQQTVTFTVSDGAISGITYANASQS